MSPQNEKPTFFLFKIHRAPYHEINDVVLELAKTPFRSQFSGVQPVRVTYTEGAGADRELQKGGTKLGQTMRRGVVQYRWVLRVGILLSLCGTGGKSL